MWKGGAEVEDISHTGILLKRALPGHFPNVCVRESVRCGLIITPAYTVLVSISLDRKAGEKLLVCKREKKRKELFFSTIIMRTSSKRPLSFENKSNLGYLSTSNSKVSYICSSKASWKIPNCSPLYPGGSPNLPEAMMGVLRLKSVPAPTMLVACKCCGQPL